MSKQRNIMILEGKDTWWDDEPMSISFEELVWELDRVNPQGVKIFEVIDGVKFNVTAEFIKSVSDTYENKLRDSDDAEEYEYHDIFERWLTPKELRDFSLFKSECVAEMAMNSHHVHQENFYV